MINKIVSLVFIGLIFLSGCSTNKAPEAKYVFLFIGDGMGANQVYSTELFKVEVYGQSNSGLSFSHFPVQSYATTYSASNLITCSSAAGTALSTGLKTKNGVVCKDTSLTENYTTIAEKAKQAGYKIGILSSVYMNHATPACFYAHQNSRKEYYPIGMQMAGSNFDYFAGGNLCDPKGTLNDQADVIEYTVSQGYHFVNTTDGFKQLKKGDEKVFAVNPNNYEAGEFRWEIDSTKNNISLADFTAKGIELLDNDKGFFMMVEGGKIDWACHSNDVATSIYETMAFDSAVSVALDFYYQHPDETLIIVTADHETGGMATGNNHISYNLDIELLTQQKASLGEFNKVIKALNKSTSFGQVLDLINRYFGFENNPKWELTPNELALIKDAYLRDVVDKTPDKKDNDYCDINSKLNVAGQVLAIFNAKAGIGWTTYSHTAVPVPVRVIGQGQDYFKSVIDNTDIPKTIEKLMGL